MPRYTPLVARAKAEQLTKNYTQNGLNQSRLAKKEGCTSQNICQKLKKAPVQKTFAEKLDKAGITDKFLVKVGKEGLGAVRPDPLGPGILPDYNCRHKYWQTSLEAKGHIKHTNGKDIMPSITIVNIIKSMPIQEVKIAADDGSSK